MTAQDRDANQEHCAHQHEHILLRDAGLEVTQSLAGELRHLANLVAQRLVIPPHRDGGQAQFLPRPLPRQETNPLAPLMEWIRSNPKLPHRLPGLARRAGMSPRTLQRHFRAASGLSPKQWLVRERVALAKEALEGSNAPFWKVAESVGFGTEESFRRHFRLITGTSPGRYRERFAAG